MEFAEWVVSGLDQLRLGQLPAGNDFYAAVSAGLGNDPRLAAYMNSGDPAQRAELVQAVAAAVAANPGLEQQLRNAAAAAPQAQGPAGGKPSFFKTTNGMLVIVAAAVVVIGGGIGLAVGLGGSGGDLASIAKGTWSCRANNGEISGHAAVLTVGDGTWSLSGDSGTWKQNGSTATLHDDNDPENDVKVSGLPSGAGSFNVALGPAKDTAQLVQIHAKGTLSAHKLTITVPGDSGNVDITCTK